MSHPGDTFLLSKLILFLTCLMSKDPGKSSANLIKKRTLQLAQGKQNLSAAYPRGKLEIKACLITGY